MRERERERKQKRKEEVEGVEEVLLEADRGGRTEGYAKE